MIKTRNIKVDKMIINTSSNQVYLFNEQVQTYKSTASQTIEVKPLTFCEWNHWADLQHKTSTCPTGFGTQNFYSQRYFAIMITYLLYDGIDDDKLSSMLRLQILMYIIYV